MLRGADRPGRKICERKNIRWTIKMGYSKLFDWLRELLQWFIK